MQKHKRSRRILENGIRRRFNRFPFSSSTAPIPDLNLNSQIENIKKTKKIVGEKKTKKIFDRQKNLFKRFLFYTPRATAAVPMSDLNLNNWRN